VVDASGLVISQYFELMKTFIANIVGRLDVDSGSTRVGLVVYTSGVESTFSLDAHSSVASLQQTILSLNYRPGETNTAAALDYVRRIMLTPEKGDRSNVSNVVVLFIDENSDNRTATQVS